MKLTFDEKRFVIGSDASAFTLKETLKQHFAAQGYEIVDVGTLDPAEPVSYYEAGANAARAVAEGKFQFGIVLCGSGMGVCMAANKFPGVYCAVCETIHTAEQARTINNANILALGANIVAPNLAIKMAETFIKTSFLQGIENAADREFLTDALNQLSHIQQGIKKDFA